MSYQKAAEKKIRQSRAAKEREAQTKRYAWFHGNVADSAPEHQTFTKHAMQIYHAVAKYDGFIAEHNKTYTLGLGKNDKDKPYTPRKVVDMMLDSFEWNVDQSFAIFGMPERAMDLKERGIKDVTILVIEDTPNSLAKAIAKALGYKYSTIKEIGMKKFDAVIANPPYDGNLHMKFFNASIEWVVKDGIVCFIQPATPYYFKKEWSVRGNGDPKGPLMTMRANLSKCDVNATFHVGVDIFTKNGLDELSITTCRKTPGSMNITYMMTGEKYENVAFSDINIHHINPDTYHAIREKYMTFISKMGSLDDLRDRKMTDHPKYVRIWGIGTKDTMRPNLKCCMIPIKGQFENRKGTEIPSSNPGMGGQKEGSWSGNPLNLLQDVEGPSFYSYVKTDVARFGLGLSKIDVNIDSGELKTVPLVPFDRHWTNEELAEMIGLTDEELEVIYRAIPDSYKQRGAKLDSFMEE